MGIFALVPGLLRVNRRWSTRYSLIYCVVSHRSIWMKSGALISHRFAWRTAGCT